MSLMQKDLKAYCYLAIGIAIVSAVILIILTAGVGFLIFGGKALSGGLRSKAWPGVGGLIVYSEKIKGPDSSRIDIRYQYTYKGRNYLGEGVHLWKIDNDSGDLEKYPVDAEVIVFVNPKNPNQSVLEPGVSWLFVALFLPLGLFFSFVALHMIWNFFISAIISKDKSK